jgi:hypothetical protein
MIKSKWIMPALMALALVTAVFSASGCKKAEPAKSGTQAHQYTCAMHPEVVQDKPGKCPKCGTRPNPLPCTMIVVVATILAAIPTTSMETQQ